MSDDRPNRPDPATDPMLPETGPFKALDRYRPDPGRAASDAARGRITHTEQERQALVDRAARSMAEATANGLVGPSPVRPPLVDALQAMMDTNVAEQTAPLLPVRATAVGDLRRAEEQIATATTEVQEGETTVATVEAARPTEPAGGRHLTQRWVPLVVLPILVFVECQLTAPSLRAALATTTTIAMLVAAAIAVVSVLVAELVGAGLAAAVMGRRRAARAILALIAVSTFVTLVVGVVALVHSREANVRYQNSLKAQAEDSGDGSFGGNSTQASAGPADPTRSPSLGFVAPLTLAGVLAACGLAMRVSLAAPMREWEGREAVARHDLDELRDRLDEARDTRATAATPVDENDLRIGAIVETEQGVHNNLIERFRGEYPRACHALNTRPVDLITDDVVLDQRPIHHRLIDPDRATSTQPVVVPTQVQIGEPAPVIAPAAEAPVEPPIPLQEPLMPMPQIPPLPSGGHQPPPPVPAPAPTPEVPAQPPIAPQEPPTPPAPAPAVPVEPPIAPHEPLIPRPHVSPLPSSGPRPPAPALALAPFPASRSAPAPEPAPALPTVPPGSWIQHGRPPGWQSPGTHS